MNNPDIFLGYLDSTEKNRKNLLNERDLNIEKLKSSYVNLIEDQKMIIKKMNGNNENKLKHENWVLKQEIKKLHEKNRKLISQLVQVVNESKQGNVEFNYVNGNIEKVYPDHIQEFIPVTKKTNRKRNDKELKIISENERFIGTKKNFANTPIKAISFCNTSDMLIKNEKGINEHQLHDIKDIQKNEKGINGHQLHDIKDIQKNENRNKWTYDVPVIEVV
jgi:hypothetical protein